MATEAILVDIGALYKRLFNHRPIIQNEVHYFVKEFESKREDSDLKALQDAMTKADEINNVFLPEIWCSNPHFLKTKEKLNIIKSTCEDILNREKKDVGVSQEDQESLDQQVEEYRQQLKQKEQDLIAINEQEIVKLKEEIEQLRQSRNKMRSHASSLSSSITIYPSATSPDGGAESHDLTEELAEAEEGGEGGEEAEEGGEGEKKEEDMERKEQAQERSEPETDNQPEDETS